MKPQEQESEKQIIGIIVSDRELLLPWILKGCQTLTVLVFIYLPWISDGNAYHQDCWTTHAWVWERVSGDGPIRINLPMIVCELMAIWLAYWFIRSSFPKSDTNSRKTVQLSESNDQE